MRQLTAEVVNMLTFVMQKLLGLLKQTALLFSPALSLMLARLVVSFVSLWRDEYLLPRIELT